MVWANAAQLDGFRQVHPGDNLDPSQPTKVLIGYDRRAYLAFRADDASAFERRSHAAMLIAIAGPTLNGERGDLGAYAPLVTWGLTGAQSMFG
jgi:hypothetical protein